MRTGFMRVLWGLGAVGILAMGLFVCGDQACPHRLTCTDLLKLPIEDLMEVRILSKVEDPARGPKPAAPSPSALWEGPFKPSSLALTVS